MSDLRIFSYLPNPRIWKATIAARLCGVEVEVIGAAPRDLQNWLWDFDAHHGNGTEEIVGGNDRIRFASIHQYPCYPGTGAVSQGNVYNLPIPPRSEASRHASAVRQALDRLVEFDPGIVLVSAGFDAYIGDPLTEMTLEQEHFASFGRWLKETGLPAAPILEGGYSNDLPLLVDAFLEGWGG